MRFIIVICESARLSFMRTASSPLLMNKIVAIAKKPFETAVKLRTTVLCGFVYEMEVKSQYSGLFYIITATKLIPTYLDRRPSRSTSIARNASKGAMLVKCNAQPYFRKYGSHPQESIAVLYFKIECTGVSPRSFTHSSTTGTHSLKPHALHRTYWILLLATP